VVVDEQPERPRRGGSAPRGNTYRKRPRGLRKVQTFTLVRHGGGRWNIAAFQNTMRKPLMEAISFRFQPASKPSPSEPIQD
jgi:hypothetical protein